MGCVIVHIAESVIGTQIGLRLFLILGCDHGSKNAVVMQTFFSYRRGRAVRGEVLVIVAHHVCVICIFDVRNRLDHFLSGLTVSHLRRMETQNRGGSVGEKNRRPQ